MPQTAFPSNPEMTNICSAYTNEEFVANRACPFTPSVDKKEFKYDKFPIGEQITPQDDRVSRKGEIAELDYSSQEELARIEDRALSAYVPYDDYKNANDGSLILNRAALNVRKTIELNREIRVANMIFNTDSYKLSNVIALSSGDKFSDPNSNAMDVINKRLDKMLMRANTMTLSQSSWLALRSNPFIVKACQGGSDDGTGMATIAQVTQLFELKEIIVASANRNVGNNPKSLNAGKIWGNNISLSYLEPAAQLEGCFTFCATVPYEKKDGITAGDDFDRKRGVRGSYEVRVAQQIKEIIIAPEAGSLITGVV